MDRLDKNIKAVFVDLEPGLNNDTRAIFKNFFNNKNESELYHSVVELYIHTTDLGTLHTLTDLYEMISNPVPSVSPGTPNVFRECRPGDDTKGENADLFYITDKVLAQGSFQTPLSIIEMKKCISWGGDAIDHYGSPTNSSTDCVQYVTQADAIRGCVDSLFTVAEV